MAVPVPAADPGVVANERGEVARKSVFRFGLVLHITVLLVSAAILASTAGYALWLVLGSPQFPKSGTTTVREFYDGVKLALAVVAGFGAVVALSVAYRKQRLQEEDDRRAELSSRRDDVKLFNERFKAAAEQLGSEKAAVRLSGVYAFQALADDWTEGRQMCVEVLAAYLRMPFPGPFDKPRSSVAGDGNGRLAIVAPVDSAELHDGYQELQVRLAVQKVFASRLRREKLVKAPGGLIGRIPKMREEQSGEYGDPAWPNISAVLTGATLIDAEFYHCAFADIDCRDAVFYGRSSFSWCQFVGVARFDGAIFVDSVVFSGATFDAWASFADASFVGGAYFNSVTRNHDLEFNSSQFYKAAQFERMRVGSKGALYFSSARFNGPTTFSGTDSFHEDAFVDATAGRRATFKDLPSAWENVGGRLAKRALDDEHAGA
ncbi:pentapeptide repeat-containing protein [Micromonospora tulbaghiae]|uniref:pentapeptide repeat-containing protein n=1 Tax=Micromonospora tulbaghiae TaxID=479978 RepID=UPI0033F7D7B4